MVVLRSRFLGLYLMFGCVLATTEDITLSHFQGVTGFSKSCTDTYNTPLSDCTSLDFDDGGQCSDSCIDFLDELTATIQKACQGAKAYPTTLIGLFFIFEGTKAVCPNARRESVLDEADVIEDQPTIVLTSMSSPSNAPESIDDSSAPAPETPVTTTSAPPVQSEAVPETRITSVTPSDFATLPTAATSITTIPLSVLTAATPIAAAAETTTKAPKLEATIGDGGGTPFDITSSSDRNLIPMWLGAWVMLCFGILTWLV
jgi:hypothetical protein